MFKKRDRVIHKKWGVGTVHEDSMGGTTLVFFDKHTEYGDLVEVSTGMLRYQDAVEEYEEMYCENCGGTSCIC